MSVEHGYLVYDEVSKMYYQSNGQVTGWVNHKLMATIFLTREAAWDVIVYSPNCQNREVTVLTIKIVIVPEKQ